MKEAITYSEKFEQSLKEIDQFVAQKVESLVDEPFQMPNSMLFAIDYVRGEVPAIKKIAESADVYDMLGDPLNAVLVGRLATTVGLSSLLVGLHQSRTLKTMRLHLANTLCAGVFVSCQ